MAANCYLYLLGQETEFALFEGDVARYCTTVDVVGPCAGRDSVAGLILCEVSYHVEALAVHCTCDLLQVARRSPCE